MNRKEIREIANLITQLERKKDYSGMESLISSMNLSVEDMLRIDEYITKKNLLTK